MATAPTNSTKPKRVQGPRTAKDKNVILMFKGTLEGEVQVAFDPWEAMDAKEKDPNLQIKKITIPSKKRAAPAQTAPTA